MAIFVTPNTGLVNHANEYFKNEIPTKKYIPLVVSEQWMTAVFWLKCPEIFNTLPMDQIIASAYGLLYTDDRFWNSFIDKLQVLESKGQITEDDLIVVRWDSDLLGLIHDVSVDVGEDFTEKDVFDIVEKIKNKHTQEKDAEITQIKNEKDSEIKGLESEIASKDRLISNTQIKMRKISNSIGITASGFFCLLLMSCVFWTAYTSLPIDLVNYSIIQTYKKSFLTISALFITSVFSFMGTIFGWNVISVYKWIKSKVSSFVYELLIG